MFFPPAVIATVSPRHSPGPTLALHRRNAALQPLLPCAVATDEWAPPFLFLPAHALLLLHRDQGCLLPPTLRELPARALSAAADSVSRSFLFEDVLPAN